MDDIQCAICDNRLSFGGSSGDPHEMLGEHPMEGMALTIGWHRDFAGRWICRFHDSAA